MHIRNNRCGSAGCGKAYTNIIILLDKTKFGAKPILPYQLAQQILSFQQQGKSIEGLQLFFPFLEDQTRITVTVFINIKAIGGFKTLEAAVIGRPEASDLD